MIQFSILHAFYTQHYSASAKNIGNFWSLVIITSLVAPYINHASERRNNRAAVMQSIIQVEADRWAGRDGASFIEFQRSTVNLKATAMVAGGIDPRIVNEYIRVAKVARRASDNDVAKTDEDDVFAGGIASSLSDLVSDSAEDLISYVA